MKKRLYAILLAAVALALPMSAELARDQVTANFNRAGSNHRTW